LALFTKTRVKEEKVANVTHRNGSSGSSLFWLVAVLAGFAVHRRSA